MLIVLEYGFFDFLLPIYLVLLHALCESIEDGGSVSNPATTVAQPTPSLTNAPSMSKC